MLRPLSVLLCATLVSFCVAAADTYDAATNVLSIPLVKVGDSLYQDVKVTVGSVVSVGAGPNPDTFDTYNASNGQYGVTPESPTTSVYHYFITDSYPYVPRCVFGAPATWGNDAMTN